MSLRMSLAARTHGVALAALVALAGLAVVGSTAGVAAAATTTAHPFVERATPAGARHGAGAAALPTDNQDEVEANRPVPVPSTTSCTETVMQHTFANSYGTPFVGTYTPTTCAAPWNTIVMTFTSAVAGTQFDRTVLVDIGGAQVLQGTTSEPCCTGNGVTWSVQQDLTDYAALFTTAQPVVVELDNVNDSTYTGQYDSTLTLAFYETGPGAPAPTVPSGVVGISPQAVTPASSGSFAGDDFSIGAAGQLVGREVTFPRNLSGLSADLYAEGQGPCEEFWYTEPSDCGAGSPYREVAVYIDGTLAGAAPVYPTAFTGDSGPGLWEPIPSPRAWNLRAYRVDLTPFVGQLTDGAPHDVQLGISDAIYASGDFWNVAANLLLSTQSYAPVTSGALTSVGTPAISETATSDPSGQNAEDGDTVATSRTWTGYVTGADGGRILSTVTEKVGLTSTEATAAVDDAWTWDRQTSTVADGVETDVTSAADFSVVTSDLTHFGFTDDDATSTYVGGTATATQRNTEDMMTTDTTGLAFNGTESEDYAYADTAGACYQKTIAAVAGQDTTTSDAMCPATTAVPLLAAGGSTPTGPTPGLAESPLAVLPLLAGAGVVATIVRRRRGVTPPPRVPAER